MNIRTFSTLATLALLTVACGGSQKPPLPKNEIAVTPIGVARGGSVDRMVPATGATLTSADGRLKIEIPAGALATSQMLSIQTISNEAPGGVGIAYRLGPEGTTFSAPVKLTFVYDTPDIAGSEALALQIAYQDSKGSWNALKSITRDEVAKTISATTKHFSDWSLVEGWQLRQAMAILKASASIELVVNNCSSRVAGTDELAELMFKCRPDPDFFTVQQWAANGVVNGNSSVGTIKNPTDTTATYVAPAMAPAANPVSVSATVTDKTTKRKTTLTSNIFVDAHPPLKGIITALTKDGDLVVTSIARVRFIWDTVLEAYQPDPLASRLEVNWGASTTACETKATFDGPILRTDAHILFVDQNYFSAGFTNGTVTGTTTCNIGHSLDPFSMNDDLQWWPVPPLPLTVKPDGTLNDGFKDDVRDGSGKTSSSQWLLTPEVMP